MLMLNIISSFFLSCMKSILKLASSSQYLVMEKAALLYIFMHDLVVLFSIDGRINKGLLSYLLCIAGIEARGFIFGPPIALAIGAKFVPMRKPKKLPGINSNLYLLFILVLKF